MQDMQRQFNKEISSEKESKSNLENEKNSVSQT
jgi:hypothetical protein